MQVYLTISSLALLSGFLVLLLLLALPRGGDEDHEPIPIHVRCE